jgi:hypothetical protein
VDPSVRRHVEQDAKGVADAGRANLRSALKRVGGKPKPENAARNASKTGQWAQRSAQAALGMIGRPPGSFDEAQITEWLGQMTPEQLRKLGRLVWLARQEKEAKSPGLDKVERQMERQGIRLEVHGHNVTVNLGQDRGRPPAYPSRRPNYRADWGRQLGRIRDFINGH